MKLKCRCERMVPINIALNSADCECGLVYLWKHGLWRCELTADMVPEYNNIKPLELIAPGESVNISVDSHRRKINEIIKVINNLDTKEKG